MKTTWPAKPKTSTVRLCTEDGLTPGLDPLTLLAWSSFKVLGLWEGWGGLPLGAHGFQTAKPFLGSPPATLREVSTARAFLVPSLQSKLTVFCFPLNRDDSTSLPAQLRRELS